MEIVQCEYYREQSSNYLYKAIGNQPLPDEYRDKESDEFYKDYYYFFVVDPKETDLKKLMFLDYVDTKNLDLVPATKKEVEFYKAVERILQYQEMQMLQEDSM